MIPRPAESDDAILAARPAVPEHVVHREFPEETIVLNVRTGLYHGLNPTAGRMLARLDGGTTVADAAATLATELGQPADVVRRDLLALCRRLRERGLIELDAPA